METVLMVGLDGMMVVLLSITILYCWKLNTRIRVLQDSKSELAQLILKFDVSMQQATRSITEIHNASKKISENIKAKLDKAQYVADDLSFMIEKGNKLIGRMDSPAPTARALTRQRQDAETENTEESPRSGRGLPPKEKKSGTLESMMDKMALSGKEKAAGTRQRVMGARIRSQAEQELYDALKAKH